MIEECENKSGSGSFSNWRMESRSAIALEQIGRFGFNGKRSTDILDIGFGGSVFGTKLNALGDVDTVDINTSGDLGEKVSTSHRKIGKRYDLITALDVIGSVDDDAQAMEEMCSLLRPGGKLLVSVAVRGVVSDDEGLSEAGRRRYSASEFARLLGNYGQLRRIRYIHGIDLVLRLGGVIGSRLGLDVGACEIGNMKLADMIKDIFMAEYKFSRYFPMFAGTTIIAVISKPVLIRVWQPRPAEVIQTQADYGIAA